MTHENKIKNENNETVKAGCVVVNERGEVLLVSKIDEDVWTFPKGHAEDGESLENTAVREVLEETGYKVEIISRLSDLKYEKKDTGELVSVSMYKARAVGEAREHEPNTKSKWCSVDEARGLLYKNLVHLLD